MNTSETYLVLSKAYVNEYTEVARKRFADAVLIHDQYLHDHLLHMKRKPGIIRKIASLGKARREWELRRAELEQNIAVYDEILVELRHEMKQNGDTDKARQYAMDCMIRDHPDVIEQPDEHLQQNFNLN